MTVQLLTSHCAVIFYCSCSILLPLVSDMDMGVSLTIDETGALLLANPE